MFKAIHKYLDKRKYRKNLLRGWDKLWRETDENKFTKFYCVIYQGISDKYPIGDYHYMLYNTELIHIREKWRGNMKTFLRIFNISLL